MTNYRELLYLFLKIDRDKLFFAPYKYECFLFKLVHMIIVIVSLTPPLLTEVTVPRQECSGHVWKGYRVSPFYNFSLGFCNCPDSLVFFYFHFIHVIPITFCVIFYIYCNH